MRPATNHRNVKSNARSEPQRRPHQWICWIPRDERRVGATIRSRALGDGTKTRTKVPSIVLAGEWLRRAGFKPGTRILIMVQVRGQIIIDLL